MFILQKPQLKFWHNSLFVIILIVAIPTFIFNMARGLNLGQTLKSNGIHIFKFEYWSPGIKNEVDLNPGPNIYICCISGPTLTEYKVFTTPEAAFFSYCYHDF